MAAPYSKLALIQGLAGEPVWTYRLRDDAVFHTVEEGIEDGAGSVIFVDTEKIEDVTAWIQPDGIRAVGIQTLRGISRRLYYYEYFTNAWSRYPAPLTGQGGAQISAATLPPSRRVRVLHRLMSGGIMRLAAISLFGRQGDYRGEQDYVEDTGGLLNCNDPGHLWVLSNGHAAIVYTDDADDLQLLLGDTRMWTWLDPFNPPILIRADRTDAMAVRLEPSNDVFVVCRDLANNLKLNVLRWDGAAYAVDAEIDIGDTTIAVGGMWQGNNGQVGLAYLDAAGDLIILRSDLSGGTWA